ncbi:uncharacterized protein [Dysidea avara]|uniref:uncharacterized protein n=1 Tax=Dysidea avara TaxID=196820 RepID=UPI0033269C16
MWSSSELTFTLPVKTKKSTHNGTSKILKKGKLEKAPREIWSRVIDNLVSKLRNLSTAPDISIVIFIVPKLMHKEMKPSDGLIVVLENGDNTESEIENHATAAP